MFHTNDWYFEKRNSPYQRQLQLSVPVLVVQCENAVLSGYITTLKIKQKLDVSSEGPSSRVSSRDRGKCTGFYTKSMKASRDKKINQLDGFNHNKV
jgi:hypothetical protein